MCKAPAAIGWIVGILVACLALGAEAVGTQQESIRKPLDELSNPKISLDQKSRDVDTLIKQGEESAQRLLPVSMRLYETMASSYPADFEKAAAATLRAGVKDAKVVDEEVASLRKRVLAISRGGHITKQAITDTCDPAMKRLSELLAITPRQVLERNAALKLERDEFLAYRSWWERAAGKIHPTKRDPIPQPPSKSSVEATLRADETLAADLATPMSAADRGILIANVARGASLDPSEAEGILILNMMRIRLGIGAQTIDLKLCEAARGHSRDMSEKHFFSHESPVQGKETPWKRAALAGTRASAENIETGTSTAEDSIRGWWHSPGHHANMMAAHKRVGLGHYDDKWTQMFGD